MIDITIQTTRINLIFAGIRDRNVAKSRIFSGPGYLIISFNPLPALTIYIHS